MVINPLLEAFNQDGRFGFFVGAWLFVLVSQSPATAGSIKVRVYWTARQGVGVYTIHFPIAGSTPLFQDIRLDGEGNLPKDYSMITGFFEPVRNAPSLTSLRLFFFFFFEISEAQISHAQVFGLGIPTSNRV